MDLYLNKCLLAQVTIFLDNGVKLSGIITKIYPDSLVLCRDAAHQLVALAHIATVMPNDSFDIE